MIEELYRDAATTRVNTAALSIPICVVVQIALVRLLRAWGIEAAAVTSHSSGEIVAAYTVGALDLQQSMAAAYYRVVMAGEIIKRGEGPKGAMAAIGVGEDAARKYLGGLTEQSGKAVVACVNSPDSVTISGDKTAVVEVVSLAEEDNVFARRLRVETAYHSHHMDPMAEDYRQALRSVFPSEDNASDQELDVIFSSPVTGGRISHARQLRDPEHWVQSLVQPVEFVKSLTDMVLGRAEDPTGNIDVILEVGPHTALGGPIKETLVLPEFAKINLPYMGCLVRKEDACDCMFAAALNLLRRGQLLNLPKMSTNFAPVQSVLTDLPSYPWNHSVRHWIESRHSATYRAREQSVHHLLGLEIPGAIPKALVWRQQVRVSESTWLRDHVVQGSILYPGSGYLCLAIEAMKQIAEKNAEEGQLSSVALRDVEIYSALVVPDNAGGIELQTSLQSVSDKDISARDWKRWEISSVTADNRWAHHAHGLIQAKFDAPPPKIAGSIDHGMNYVRQINPEDLWAGLRALGLNHGPSFRNISSIKQDGCIKDTRRCVTTITVPDASAAFDKHVIHPATLDSIVVTSLAALPIAGANDQGPRVPRSIRSFRISTSMNATAGHEYVCNTKLPHNDLNTLSANITLADGQHSVLEIRGLVLQSLGPSGLIIDEPWNRELCTEMRWAPDLTKTLSLNLSGASQGLQKMLNPAGKTWQYEKDILMRLRRVCVSFCLDAVQDLAIEDLHNLTPYHAKYFAWMKDVLDLAAAKRLGPKSDSWMSDSKQVRQRNIALAASQSVEGELVCSIGPMLV